MEPDMLDGRAGPPLLEVMPLHGAVSEIVRITAREVFVPDDDYDRSLGAGAAIAHLLEHSYATAGGIGYERALAATDHVSGMTDSYALQTYQESTAMLKSGSGGMSGWRR